MKKIDYENGHLRIWVDDEEPGVIYEQRAESYEVILPVRTEFLASARGHFQAAAAEVVLNLIMDAGGEPFGKPECYESVWQGEHFGDGTWMELRCARTYWPKPSWDE